MMLLILFAGCEHQLGCKQVGVVSAFLLYKFNLIQVTLDLLKCEHNKI